MSLNIQRVFYKICWLGNEAPNEKQKDINEGYARPFPGSFFTILID